MSLRGEAEAIQAYNQAPVLSFVSLVIADLIRNLHVITL